MALSDLQIQTLARDAVQRASAGDFAGAEPLLAQVADARPNSGQALHLLGQARLKLGRFAEAREPLERAARLPEGVGRNSAYAALDVRLARDAAPLAAVDVLNEPTFVSKRVGCIVLRPVLDLTAVCLK